MAIQNVQFSLDGWRENLSDELKKLRAITTDILKEGEFDENELKEVVDELISMSNSFNYIHTNAIEGFNDVSKANIPHLDEGINEDDHQSLLVNV